VEIAAEIAAARAEAKAKARAKVKTHRKTRKRTKNIQKMAENVPKSLKIFKKHLFLAVLGAWTMVSCGPAPILDELTTFEEHRWHMDSVVQVQWEPQDSGIPVFMSLYVRHLSDYPYNNLFLFRTISTMEGVAYADTVNVHLADDLGHWNGSGMSDLKTMMVPVGKSAVRFKKGERYTLRVQHGMRDTVLYGIQDVGVRLLQADQP
jgi:gliding motility-associated lipoprotein GldH